MSWFERLARMARIVFRQQRVEDEMNEEMRLHIDLETEENRRAGMSPEEARRAALISFGGVERFKEQGRSERGGRWFDDLQRDVRRALRSMRLSPGFTAIALSMLALGIGANSAIFSVINAVLIQPLPFHEPDRLVQIYESHRERGWDRFSFSQPNAIDVMERTTTFEGVGLFGGRSATITGAATPEQIGLGTVTPGFFTILGVTLRHGRDFTDSDLDVEQAHRVLLLSEDLWINRFGADPQIVGQTVYLDMEGYQVVGVLPRGTPWLDMDAYEPLVLDPERNRSDHRWAMVARLRDGIAIDVARAELAQLGARMDEMYAGMDEDMGFVVDPSETWAASDELRRSLWIFMGATSLLLLIACLNLANLQLARLGARMRQVTLSLALGASRGRIVRQLLTESAVLGLMGGVLGLVVARIGLRGLVALEPGNVSRITEVEVNGTVLLFGLTVSLLAGIAAGLLPAMRMFSDNIGNALRDSGTKSSGGRRAAVVRSWLVGTETALSLVLLVGAGLLIRSLAEVQSVDNGFESEGRVTYEVPIPASYALEEATALRTEFLSRIRALPQVVSASAVSMRPVGGGNTVMGILPEGETPETFGGNLSANWRAVSDDYFESMGLTVRGRRIDHSLGMDSDWEVVISESLANALWPNEDAVGRRAELWNDPERIGVIIGVVADMRERGPEQDATRAIYFSYSLTNWSPVNFVVHSSGEPMAIVPSVRQALLDIDPNVPVSRVLTMDTMVSNAMASRRFTMILLGVFAGLALLLALAGLYGVIAQSVGQRARELGVRMALGASSSEVVSLVMRQGMVPALSGIGVGLLATLGISRVIGSLLYGVSATDPITYAGVGLVLALAAAFACWVPARATLRLEASTVLRDE